jgi:DNA (cytosine-5)-methyltransferase 1
MAKSTYSNAQQIDFFHSDNSHLKAVFALNINKEKKISSAKRATSQSSFLEFFAGSGLVAESFKGIFTPIWANDICPKKKAVYAANHGSEHFHLASITEVKGVNLPTAALAWASFPCQDLSLAGLAQGIHGLRSGLVWEWLRVMDEMPQRPPLLVAENVIGLLSASSGEHYRQLHTALAKRGYQVGAMVIDAIRWLPHSRPRVFVVAVESNLAIPKELTSFTPNWLHPESVRKAAAGLDNWIWWAMPEPPPRQLTLTDIIEWNAPFADPETEARNLQLISSKNLNLLRHTPKNKKLAAPGYKRTRAGKQVLELRFDDVAGCLRTPQGGSSRQTLVIHRNGELHSRLLTIRETARLMGAPDTYQIPGTYNEGYKAMGDGVATPVARWLATKLLSPLLETYHAS